MGSRILQTWHYRSFEVSSFFVGAPLFPDGAGTTSAIKNYELWSSDIFNGELS